MLKIFVIFKPKNADHNDIRFEIDGELKGFGFISRKDNQLALTRCPICDRENYAMSVLTGQCVWCGFSIYQQAGLEIIDRTISPAPKQ